METIKQLIHSQGMTMKQVASKMDKTQATITNWNNNPNTMKVEDFGHLCYTIGVCFCKGKKIVFGDDKIKCTEC